MGGVVIGVCRAAELRSNSTVEREEWFQNEEDLRMRFCSAFVLHHVSPFLKCPAPLIAFLLLASPALANDSTAALGAGGLNLVRNQEIDLLSEDLRVGRDRIRVTYHFRNHADRAGTY